MTKPVLVVLAAGMGSRYGGLKQIDPVGTQGEAILDYSLYDAHRAGFQTAVIIIKEAIKKDFMETVGKRLEGCPMEIRYAYQELDKVPEGFTVPEGRTKPWGTSHAVLFARAELGVAPFGCMIGYRLGNTVTDNGSVARGVCQTDGEGNLTSIVERTRIEKYPGGIHFTADEGKTWEDVPGDTPVSMNMWGFTQGFVEEIARRFPEFLRDEVPQNPAKAEFYLPMTVGQLLREGAVRVKVLPTGDRWYGVTYAEDKPMVVAALKGLTDQGLYPDGLWAGSAR